MARIDRMRKVLTEGYGVKVDGVKVDAFSASAYVKVYDALDKQENRDRLEGLPLHKAMNVVWKFVR